MSPNSNHNPYSPVYHVLLPIPVVIHSLKRRIEEPNITVSSAKKKKTHSVIKGKTPFHILVET